MVLKFNGVIPLKEVHQNISHSDACVLFLTDDINYSFSTKFCEYLYFQKPIIVFSKLGATTNFIEKNNLGLAIYPDDMLNKINILEEFIHCYVSDNVNRKKFLNYFDIENIVIKIQDVLI